MQKLMLIAFVLLTVPALAQEPTKKIPPAETITVQASHPIVNVFETGVMEKGAPMIYPDPRPADGLAVIARKLKVEHAAVPKAKTVANDETPIDQPQTVENTANKP